MDRIASGEGIAAAPLRGEPHHEPLVPQAVRELAEAGQHTEDRLALLYERLGRVLRPIPAPSEVRGSVELDHGSSLAEELANMASKVRGIAATIDELIDRLDV